MRQRGLAREREMSRERLLLGGRIPLASLLHTLAVAEHLNFRQATNISGATRSIVTARIKVLEEALVIVLLEGSEQDQFKIVRGLYQPKTAKSL